MNENVIRSTYSISNTETTLLKKYKEMVKQRDVSPTSLPLRRRAHNHIKDKHKPNEPSRLAVFKQNRH